jgi:CheY-like chemotaxis protein
MGDRSTRRAGSGRRDADHGARLDDFLLTLGHELRTPINAIVGWTHLLSQQPLDDETAAAVWAIERNARQQSRIVDELIHLVERNGRALDGRSVGTGYDTTAEGRLPVAARTPSSAQSAHEAAARGRLDGLRLLLVEDDVDSREALREILRRTGAHCDAAGSGREALDFAMHGSAHEVSPLDGGPNVDDRVPGTLRRGYDCLVLDLGLPDTDGCRLLKRLRLALGGRGARLPPAIVLTALGREADRKRAFDAGFNEFAQKPLEPERLIASIGRLAAQRSSAA